MRWDHLPKPLSGSSITLRDLGDVQVYAHTDDVVASAELETGNDTDPFVSMITAAASRGRIIAIDIGCNYGVQLCRMARMIKDVSSDFLVIGMDPGKAGELVPYTLLKNGLEDDVEFIAAAAWTTSGVVEVYAEEGNSLNNRIVAGGASEVAWLSPSLSIADLLKDARPANEQPIFVKIDTQGADLEVLMGAGAHLPVLAGITEFTPWACDKRVDIPAFLTSLVETHRLFDLGGERQRRDEIIDVPAFIKQTYEAPPYWTDVLFVPRQFAWLMEDQQTS